MRCTFNLFWERRAGGQRGGGVSWPYGFLEIFPRPSFLAAHTVVCFPEERELFRKQLHSIGFATESWKLVSQGCSYGCAQHSTVDCTQYIARYRVQCTASAQMVPLLQFMESVRPSKGCFGIQLCASRAGCDLTTMKLLFCSFQSLSIRPKSICSHQCWESSFIKLTKPARALSFSTPRFAY